MLVAYDGTDFSGWQVQPAARTVQGTLEAVLSTLQGGSPVAVRGAGRTDAGVHARGQVADAALAARIGDERLASALNGLLPSDVRVLSVATVPEEFHSRYDAVAKTYVYRLDRSAAGDPFRARVALHHPYPMDTAALAEALARLPGKRDWSAFCAAACEVKDRVRTVTEASYANGDGEGRFTFAADGFLTHMVRNLVGTLLEVARGKLAPARIDAILAARDRKEAGPTAPARGLCLERVVYDRNGQEDVA